MRIIKKTFGMPMAVIAAAILASGVHAADISTPAPVKPLDAAQQPIEEIEELDEIWVRGKRLSAMIEDAEDDFFVLYNKLNKNYDYDVFCGRMSLNSGSMLMVRMCVPGFIVSNYGDAYGRISDPGDICSDRGGYSKGGSYAMYGPCTSPQLQGSRSDYAFENDPLSGFAPVTLPIEHMMTIKRPAYAANVLKVVTSDPRLLEKARNLGTLYKEMDLVQGRYVKVKADTAPPRGSRKNARYSAGPRTL